MIEQTLTINSIYNKMKDIIFLSKGKIFLIIGLYIILNYIAEMPNFILTMMAMSGTTHHLSGALSVLFHQVFGIITLGGLVLLSVSTLRNESFTYLYMFHWKGIGRFFGLLFLFIIYLIMCIAGTLLFVFPGLYAAARFSLCFHFYVDKEMSVFESLSVSAERTKNSCMSIVGAMILYSFAVLVVLVPVYYIFNSLSIFALFTVSSFSAAQLPSIEQAVLLSTLTTPFFVYPFFFGYLFTAIYGIVGEVD